MVVRRTPIPPTGGGQRPSKPPSGAAKGSAGFWIVAGVVVLGVIALGRNTPSTNTQTVMDNAAAATDMGNAQQALVSAVEAQKPPPVEALSPAAVKRGASLVALTASEGTGGEMIYSQNCYDALSRSFGWRKLDQCGGFDAEAVAVAGDEAIPAGAEATWFEPEISAGRYLKAATAAGMEATVADERLSGLQAQVARRHPATTLVIPTSSNADAPADGAPGLQPGNAG